MWTSWLERILAQRDDPIRTPGAASPTPVGAPGEPADVTRPGAPCDEALAPVEP
jgi:hypothetical protein